MTPMLNLWQALNIPQAAVLAVALAALLAGNIIPTLLDCLLQLALAVIALIAGVLGAAWPPFAGAMEKARSVIQEQLDEFMRRRAWQAWIRRGRRGMTDQEREIIDREVGRDAA